MVSTLEREATVQSCLNTCSLIFVRKINMFLNEEDGMVAWVTNPKDQRFEGSHTSGHCEVRFPTSSFSPQDTHTSL